MNYFYEKKTVVFRSAQYERNGFGVYFPAAYCELSDFYFTGEPFPMFRKIEWN